MHVPGAEPRHPQQGLGQHVERMDVEQNVDAGRGELIGKARLAHARGRKRSAAEPFGERPRRPRSKHRDQFMRAARQRLQQARAGRLRADEGDAHPSILPSAHSPFNRAK